MEHQGTVEPENAPSSSPEFRKTFEQSLPEAIAACDSLISADKRNSHALRLRASCLAIGGRILKNREMLYDAVLAQQRGVRMYPSSVDSWYELVTLCEMDESGRWAELSRQAAHRALDLERTNRQWGHRDRYLAAEQLEFLQRIAGH